MSDILLLTGENCYSVAKCNHNIWHESACVPVDFYTINIYIM